MAFNKILLSDNVTELANVKSVVFKEAVNADVNIRSGCVGSASIEVEVYGSQATAVSAGDVVYYYQIDKNNVQTLIGEFVCEPTIKTKTSYKFIAYDNAQKLNADFSQWLQANQSNFPMTVYALVSAACSVAGVTLGSSSWGLSTQSVQAFYSDGITCRDILSYAAEIGCCFVRCHADGAVYFDWYSSNANTIAPSVGTGKYAFKQDGLNYANFTTATLDRVAVHPSGEDDVAYIYPTAITSGNTIHIQNNLLLTGADAALYNAVAQNVYTVMSALGTYRPMTASLFAKENPFRAGDIVSVTDAQSVTFTSIITGMTVSNSGAVLESTGNETYDEGTGNTQKAITQLASDVVRINKLKVDWADINTAIINYLTANNVTAQNLTIVDEYGNVLATYDSSGITLGNSGEVHAEIAYNNFRFFDRDGNVYASVGDKRNPSGIAEVQLGFTAETGQTTFPLNPRANDPSAIQVRVGGVPVSSGYTPYVDKVVFNNPVTVGYTVQFDYETGSSFYQYLFGTLKPATDFGYYAIAMGENAESSNEYTTVSGGRDNTANEDYATVSGGNNNTSSGISSVVSGGDTNIASGTGSVVSGGGSNEIQSAAHYSTISGGYKNKASDVEATVSGGYKNTASGKDSTVSGGTKNTSSGSYATISGGSNNTASGNYSGVYGGVYNESSGAYSAVGSGLRNTANHKSQFVIGEYNVLDPSTAALTARGNYIEIVGNGTADNARSNARTLDWSGNEILSGTLKTGSDVIIKSSDRYKDIILKQNEASNGNSGIIRMDAGDATDQTNNRFLFLEYSPQTTAATANTGFYEVYRLPAPTKGLGASVNYEILTSKSPVTIAQGGTGKGSVTTITTMSTIATAGANITIQSGEFTYWGKVAQFNIVIKANAAIASGATVFTLKSGYRPAAASNGTFADSRWMTISTNGAVNPQSAISSGSIYAFRAFYLLA